ncbi:DUF2867 domain-containing protein [Polycladidibacter stylochi]|uniref:DUF2867 domain-containing protein n=1 Tax=Polycladidibacter stylochi TaxID=1807766 RepID=UPI00082DE25C|nr:DUF2867 domain-containing protein [Pseudovibrio stylochi]
MVIAGIHPEGSRIWSLYQEGDFIDGYSVESCSSVRTAMEDGLQFGWLPNMLMRMRNIIVKPFGIHRSNEAVSDKQQIRFPVAFENEQEILLGFDDKHLNFRISIFKDQGRMYMATWVHCHNALGRVYLNCVMPVHKVLSRQAVGRMAS